MTKNIRTLLKNIADRATADEATKATIAANDCEKQKDHANEVFKKRFPRINIHGDEAKCQDNLPTFMVEDNLGFQVRENNQGQDMIEEWRAFYGQCGKCGKPIYGKWHTIPQEPVKPVNTTDEEKDSKLAELAKEVIYSPPKCQNCPLCPLKAGQDTPTPCPQKREEYGCQWWLTEKQRCAVEVIALRDIAEK